ncbi:MAG: hypothetical protein ACFB4J_17005 [Elainellaceae cyanobacterium]
MIQNTNRRLNGTTIKRDIESYNGFSYVKDYIPPRMEAAPEIVKDAYTTKLTAQPREAEQKAAYKAATDEARLAEWAFHNATLAMKDGIRGQFGPDSNEAQAVGLKKKSERKRASRKPAPPTTLNQTPNPAT